MKELLYLKDEQLKDLIEKLFISYRETFSDAKKVLDTLSLFNLLIINNASYINLKSSEFYITSLKDSKIDMITPKEKYLNSKNIKVTELN